MRAVVLEQFGPPAEVLSPRDIPAPDLKPGFVRARMLASPINPSDLMMIRGDYGTLPKLPATPGFEGVGIIAEAGGGLLGNWLVGRRVAVLNRTGGNWAEEAIVPARQCIPLPRTLPTEQAAMFFVNPVTAYVMTRKVLAVPRGRWLMQTAAGGSLGQMIIRLGGHFGFRTLNVVRRPEQIEILKSLGADAVISFDAAREEAGVLAERIREATGGNSPRFAIDPVGGPAGSGLMHALGDGGRLLAFGSLSDRPTCYSPRELLTRTLRIEGFWLTKWLDKRSLPARLRLVRAVTKLMQAGVLVNNIGRAFSLDQISEAVQDSETVGRGGKSWLRMN